MFRFFFCLVDFFNKESTTMGHEASARLTMQHLIVKNLVALTLEIEKNKSSKFPLHKQNKK